MAAFDPDLDPHADRLDWRLLRAGFVVRYRQPPVLAASVAWLREHDYQIVSLDAGAWDDAAAMHRDLAAALGFPDYYGKNLDALNDCLGEVATYTYGSNKDTAGLVLVLDRFDRFFRADPRAAQALLDIFASHARVASLIGHRMLGLVRSDDPDLELSAVGATPVATNPAES